MTREEVSAERAHGSTGAMGRCGQWGSYQRSEAVLRVLSNQAILTGPCLTLKARTSCPLCAGECAICNLCAQQSTARLWQCGRSCACTETTSLEAVGGVGGSTGLPILPTGGALRHGRPYQQIRLPLPADDASGLTWIRPRRSGMMNDWMQHVGWRVTGLGAGGCRAVSAMRPW